MGELSPAAAHLFLYRALYRAGSRALGLDSGPRWYCVCGGWERAAAPRVWERFAMPMRRATAGYDRMTAWREFVVHAAQETGSG